MNNPRRQGIFHLPTKFHTVEGIDAQGTVKHTNFSDLQRHPRAGHPRLAR